MGKFIVMIRFPKKLPKRLLFLLLITVAVFGYAFMFSSDPVDFNTEIKPLLNKKCIACHGGVKKKGGFSLLFRQEALDTTESGKPAIIPGDPDASALIHRLTTADPEERMPYKEEPLTEAEIDLLRRWIREGAPWGEHWAYTPVKQPALPRIRPAFLDRQTADARDWVKNEIDYFVAAGQNAHQLRPSPEADKALLLRRVSLDLIGMPAPASLAERYLRDDRPEAYAELVDSLLAHPGYGERWASVWMDLARYADTKGYERDDARSIWRYRDWLIRAFNQDMPYDRFLVEQLAGDLLPDATDEQLIATAFHRNTLTNDEGGTDNEEFRVSAVIDRVNTTWEALMGTTFACVQCHSHPYDPFRHEEYYRFLAFFNNTRDEDSYAEYPLLHEYHGDDSIRFTRLTTWMAGAIAPDERKRITDFLRTWQPAINGLTADQFYQSELADTKWLIMRNQGRARLRQVDLNGRDLLLMRFKTWPRESVLSVHLDQPDGPLLFRVNLPGTKGDWTFREITLPATAGRRDLFLQYSSPYLQKADDNGIMFDWFHFTRPFPGAGKPGYDSAQAWYRKLLNATAVTRTPVMVENPPDLHRTTHIFERGNWLVQGAAVVPGTPQSLPPMPSGAPANRLGLAQWIASPTNPLTARTMINRLWEQLFGQGLAETLEDLGTQGIPPTHPELLDWLSWEFMHGDRWQVKQALRRMVLSATYRQDARISAEALAKDPYNRWYARGPRVRLSAEQVRDQALVVSGMLNTRAYGPSVMPFQPAGIWQSPWNGQDWHTETNGEQYRRAVYTYWKRSSPYPSMTTFDGAPREVCNARRIRTNTPLQALVTLNDSAYVDLARQLAYRSVTEVLHDRQASVSVPGNTEKSAKANAKHTSPGGTDMVAAIRRTYALAAGRPADGARQLALFDLYCTSLRRFRQAPEKSRETTGRTDRNNSPEMAALVVVANAVLNLDDVLVKN